MQVGSEPRAVVVLTFEEFAAQHGASRQGYGDAGMHSPARHVGKANWRAKMAALGERNAELQARRNDLWQEYHAAVGRGEIRAPSPLEQLRATAAGPDERQDVQAARRCLAKRLQRMTSHTPKDPHPCK